MSTTSSIEIEFETKPKPKEILETLLKNNWSLDLYGEKHYIPLGDDGMFDWVFEKNIGAEYIISLVEEKTLRNELIALGISWRDTNIGGEIIIDEERSLTFMLTYNRQITDYGLTDFDWYLKKILPCFKDYYISSVKCLTIF